MVNWLKKNPVKKTIVFLLIFIALVNLSHNRYNRPDRVIEWDIISYYAYLPAVFIYHDLSLQYRGENIEKFGNLIWPLPGPTGKDVIVTSMGMSFLYAPFFFVAHLVALLVPYYEADGYTTPYRFALTFSALFYVWLGLIFLAKILRRFFNDNVTAFTMIAMVAGTNLLYYSTYEAPMSHAFNFALIIVFIWQTIRFYEDPGLKKIILAGAMAGLIALIRPTNIIVLLIFFLWDIRSFDDLKERFLFFLRKYQWVLVMALMFILTWVPQFIYWYNQAGTILYFSYGAKGDRFYWDNPQIINILFSYRKGWLLYTPIMLFSFVGLFMMLAKDRFKGFFLPIFLFKVLNIYILSSWWSWWFGGGFGLRAFIDSYALLALPFAVLVDATLKSRLWKKLPIMLALWALVAFNLFQTWQYQNQLIHWDSMNKEAYWINFLKTKHTTEYWNSFGEEEAEESSDNNEETGEQEEVQSPPE
jgi:hypothetical protein